MGTIPTPPTFVAGAVLTAANLNALRDVHNFWAGPPQCYAYQTVLSSPASSTWTVVPMAAEVFDIVQSGDSPMHDNATNNSRVVFRTPGKYEVTGQGYFIANATGTRLAQIRLNAAGNAASGTQIIVSQQTPGGGAATAIPLPVVVITVSAGDYIELFVYQNSGGALDTVAGQASTFLRTRLISA